MRSLSEALLLNIMQQSNKLPCWLVFSCSALASYGAYIRPMSYSNEIGLRMLIGGVVREAALRNMHVFPVFSHYSFHGPVFRVMLRVLPSKKFQTK